jgi:3',5'-cyclic AMP phosphodiesterase CpdA
VTSFAHISDLHFGRHDRAVADALRDDLAGLAPDVVLVSGDLTQRARAAELRAARAWLDGLGLPWLAVPGNHDIPLFDVLRRLFAPLGRWRRLVTPYLAPRHQTRDMLVLGLNTARRTRWKEGRISHEQIAILRSTFEGTPAHALKVLVTHHPFLPAPTERAWTPLARAEEALVEVDASGLDLLLSGHQHRAYSSDVRRHYEKVSRTLLVAHSGTSISERRRDEPNTYNLFRWERPHLELEVRTFDAGSFRSTGCRRFRRADDGWRSLEPTA